MDLQLFLKGNLALHFYYHPQSFKKGIVKVKDIYLLIPGLPQLVNKSFFKKRVKKNRAFFSVHYYGSWFSGGRFTFNNCQKTLKHAIKFVQARKGQKTYDQKVIKWDYENLFLIGNSFGGNVILTSFLNKEDIKKIVLFAPLTFICRDELSGLISVKKIKQITQENKKALTFLRRGYPNIFKGIQDSSWDKYFQGQDKKAKIKISSDFPQTEIFHGAQDKTVEPVFSEFLQKQYPKQVRTKIVPCLGHDFELLFEKFDKTK